MGKNSKKKKKNSKTDLIMQQKRERKIEAIRLQNEKRKRAINIVLLAIYAVILIVVACHHELWRDEAQSWLIAKNLGFIKIISQLKYEAHPFMWYYVLRIFSIFGLKYNYITIIPVMLNLVATYILLNKSNFGRFTTLVIMFSSTSFFYCGILARSYSLAYLLVIILALIYKDRYEKPILYGVLIFLVMNTHILLLGFVGSLVLLDIIEFIKNKDNRKSIIISSSMFLGGVLMIALQFFSTIESTGKTIHFEYLKDIFVQMKQLFMPALNSQFFYVLTLLMIVIYLIYLVYKKEFGNLIVLSFGILFQLLFATMVYNSINASSLIYLNILFVIMQSKKMNGAVTAITILIFAFTLYSTCLVIDSDYKHLFSDSKNVAKYIEKNLKKGSTIYCELLDYCAAVNAYLPSNKYHFKDYNTDKEYTYTEYGDYYKILYDQEIYKKKDYLDSKEMDYFISSVYNKEILDEQSDNYELIYETKEEVYFSGEGYVIYKHN